MRQGYRVVRMPEDLAAVWMELRLRFAARESSDIARTRTVTELLGGNGCLVRRLHRYFGEELGRDCGHCGPCAGDAAVKLERAQGGLALGRVELMAFRDEHPRALNGARPMARFLCGSAAPALSAAKLTRHPRFGAAGETPFAVVLAAADGALGQRAP